MLLDLTVYYACGKTRTDRRGKGLHEVKCRRLVITITHRPRHLTLFFSSSVVGSVYTYACYRGTGSTTAPWRSLTLPDASTPAAPHVASAGRALLPSLRIRHTRSPSPFLPPLPLPSKDHSSPAPTTPTPRPARNPKCDRRPQPRR